MEDISVEPSEDASVLIERILACSSVYSILGIEQDHNSGAGLSKKKIKDNFVKMARTIHPDKCKAERAQLAFSKLRAAYEEVNSDFNNPKPVAPEPLPSGKAESKQRRQIAVQTSRMLRGASMDTGLEGGGGGDLSALKRYCESSSRPKFTAADSMAKPSVGGSFGASEDVKRMRFSSAPLNVRVRGMSEESMAFSSATTPVDIYQQLSPDIKSTKAEDKTKSAEKEFIDKKGKGDKGRDRAESAEDGPVGHGAGMGSTKVYTVDIGKLSPPYMPSSCLSTPNVSPASTGSGRVYDMLSRCHITPRSSGGAGAETDRMVSMCPADLSI